jgi:hypothetical protein
MSQAVHRRPSSSTYSTPNTSTPTRTQPIGPAKPPNPPEPPRTMLGTATSPVVHNPNGLPAPEPPSANLERGEKGDLGETKGKRRSSNLGWIGSGMRNDVTRRLPYYLSDWTDAWNYRVVPATWVCAFVWALARKRQGTQTE